MTEHSVTHANFTIERTYNASPARVFAAWSDPGVKSRWFGGFSEDSAGNYVLDFKVGGHEHSHGALPDGTTYTFEARYHDIVPNERLIYVYEMYLNDQRVSVSLTTVQFTPADSGTKLIVTEYGAFLDGLDDPAGRIEGTGQLLDLLGAELGGESAKTRHDAPKS